MLLLLASGHPLRSKHPMTEGVLGVGHVSSVPRVGVRSRVIVG